MSTLITPVSSITADSSIQPTAGSTQDAVDGGTYVVTSERDVRAEAASIAVAYDLLALSGQRGLEDAYLLATEAASSVGAAGQASDDDGGES